MKYLLTLLCVFLSLLPNQLNAEPPIGGEVSGKKVFEGKKIGVIINELLKSKEATLAKKKGIRDIVVNQEKLAKIKDYKVSLISMEIKKMPFVLYVKYIVESCSFSFRFSEGVIYIGDNHEYIRRDFYLTPKVKKMMAYDNKLTNIENVRKFLTKHNINDREYRIISRSDRRISLCLLKDDIKYVQALITVAERSIDEGDRIELPAEKKENEHP